MSDWRRPVQAHTPVRPPLPDPQPASLGTPASGAPVLPPLPDSVAAAAAEAGLLAPLPTDLHAVYAAAGPAAQAALRRWEALSGLRCAELAPATSGRHDPRSALPFTAGEEEGLQRLRHFLGLPLSGGGDDSSSSSSHGGGHNGGHGGAAVPAPEQQQQQQQQAAPPPIAGYQDSRMLAWGVDSSAKLSASLSLGCLSPRTVHAEVMRLAAAEAAAAAAAEPELGGLPPSAKDGASSAQPAAGAAAATAGAPPAAAVAWREPQRGDTWRWLLMHIAIRDFFVYIALREGEAGALATRALARRVRGS